MEFPNPCQINERSHHHSPDVADDLLNEGGRRIWPERGVGGRMVLALKVSIRRRHDALSLNYTGRLGLTLAKVLAYLCTNSHLMLLCCGI